jgi:hypothetical protein
VKLDGASFLLQWATGGFAFLWVTTRHREVGIGYGWLVRATYLVIAAGGVGVLASRSLDDVAHRVAFGGGILMAVLCVAALLSSIRHRTLATFDPRWDLAAPLVGVVSLCGAAGFVGGSYALAFARLVVGAAFLGCISDSMLLGHWYLVQPGLRREPVKELVRWNAWLWPAEVFVLLLPTGMVSVINGTIDDGYNGLLAWVWLACAITTIVLVGVTWLALRERFYSAVMSATGLLYLAILTAFGTDLIARASLG